MSFLSIREPVYLRCCHLLSFPLTVLHLHGHQWPVIRLHLPHPASDDDSSSEMPSNCPIHIRTNCHVFCAFSFSTFSNDKHHPNLSLTFHLHLLLTHHPFSSSRDLLKNMEVFFKRLWKPVADFCSLYLTKAEAPHSKNNGMYTHFI